MRRQDAQVKAPNDLISHPPSQRPLLAGSGLTQNAASDPQPMVPILPRCSSRSDSYRGTPLRHHSEGHTTAGPAEARLEAQPRKRWRIPNLDDLLPSPRRHHLTLYDALKR